jgi:DNA-binding transcriptional LysR family regulator
MDLAADGVTDAVATGGAEFGVGMEGAQHPEVEFRPLRQDPFVLACRRDHPLAARRGGALRWRDLEDERLVGVSRRSGNRLILDRALLPRGINPHWLYEAEHLSTSLGLVEAGLGVAVVPRLALPRGAHPVWSRARWSIRWSSGRRGWFYAAAPSPPRRPARCWICWRTG